MTGVPADKKKLLLMSPMLHQGGFEKVCVETARLLNDDFDVRILIFSDQDIHYDVTGLKIVNINVPSAKNKALKAVNVLRRARAVREYKTRHRIDIAYSFGSSANYVNVLSRAGEKTLTGLRCSTDMEAPREVSLFCERSDAVLSCSKEILRALEADYGYQKSRYVYNPVDIAALREKAAEPLEDFPDWGEENEVLITLARDDKIKGLWHLVKAFSLVADKHETARLIILGAGSYARAKELALALGVDDKIFFGGNRKNPFPYVARSDLYLLPSNHEGFPNALLEAMALEKPVIAADCKTGPREIVLSETEYEALIREQPNGVSTKQTIRGAFGTLIPDLGAKEDYNPAHMTAREKVFAEEILLFLKEPRRRELMKVCALRGVERFTPERYRETIKEVLLSV